MPTLEEQFGIVIEPAAPAPTQAPPAPVAPVAPQAAQLTAPTIPEPSAPVAMQSSGNLEPPMPEQQPPLEQPSASLEDQFGIKVDAPEPKEERPDEDRSFFDDAWNTAADFAYQMREQYTGKDRATEMTNNALDWQDHPTIAGSPWYKKLALTAATLNTDNEETAAQIYGFYPELQYKTDEKGNYAFMHKGVPYAVKPGMNAWDVARGSVTGLTEVLASPAKKAKAIATGVLPALKAGIQNTLKEMVASGAVSTVREGIESLAQGDFDTANILIDFLSPAAIDAVVKPTKEVAKAGAKKAMKAAGYGVAKDFTEEAAARAAKAQGAEAVEGMAKAADGAAAAPTAQAIPTPEAPSPKEILDPFDEVDELIDYEISAAEKANLAETAVASVEGLTGKKRASEALAKKATIDPEILKSAKRLKVERYLQPDHMSSDFAYKELAQLAKSQKGSAARDAEQAGLNVIGKKAKKMIENFGGTDNLGGLNDEIEDTMRKTIEAYEGKAEKAYSKIAAQIPKGTEVGVENTKAYFDDLLAEMKGDPNNLEKVQKELYEWIEADPNPTYKMLDQKRRSIGAKIKQRDFSSEDQAILKRMYGHITKDLEGSLDEISPGLSDQWEYAKGLVRVRKGIEDDMQALFGQKLDKSIVDKLLQSNKQLGKTDGKKFAALMKSIPKTHRQAFAASSIEKAFGNATEDGVLNYKSFSDWWDNMSKNKQAKTALMSNLPKGAEQRLEDIANVSRGVADARKKYTGTGASLQQLIDPAEGLMGAVMGAGKTGASAAMGYSMGGTTGAALGTGMGILMGIKDAVRKSRGKASERIHDLITSKEFLDMSIAAAEEGSQKETATRNLLNSPKFKAFAKSAKIENPTDWLNTAIRTTARPAVRETVEKRQPKER